MNYLLFCCKLFILAQFVNARLVVLEPIITEYGTIDEGYDEDFSIKSESLDEPDSENEQSDDGQEISDENIKDNADVKKDNGIMDKSNDDRPADINNTEISEKNVQSNEISTWDIWASEINAANKAEIMGSNPHIYQPDKYLDLSRRFVPQYPYKDMKPKIGSASEDHEIIPIEAPLEIVEMVAKQSALIEASKPDPIDENFTKKILRSGDYWNGVWKEEVDPQTALRMPKHRVLRTIKAEIKPGNKFYDLVTSMQKISPRLLYIINN